MTVGGVSVARVEGVVEALGVWDANPGIVVCIVWRKENLIGEVWCSGGKVERKPHGTTKVKQDGGVVFE